MREKEGRCLEPGRQHDFSRNPHQSCVYNCCDCIIPRWQHFVALIPFFLSLLPWCSLGLEEGDIDIFFRAEYLTSYILCSEMSYESTLTVIHCQKLFSIPSLWLQCENYKDSLAMCTLSNPTEVDFLLRPVTFLAIGFWLTSWYETCVFSTGVSLGGIERTRTPQNMAQQHGTATFPLPLVKKVFSFQFPINLLENCSGLNWNSLYSLEHLNTWSPLAVLFVEANLSRISEYMDFYFPKTAWYFLPIKLAQV